VLGLGSGYAKGETMIARFLTRRRRPKSRKVLEARPASSVPAKRLRVAILGGLALGIATPAGWASPGGGDAPVSIQAVSGAAGEERGSAERPEDPEAADAEIARRFRFERPFWFGLHRLLMQQAALDPSIPRRGPSRVERVDASSWSEAERAAWDSALEVYVEHHVRRSPLFDGGMVSIENRLAQLPASEVPTGGGPITQAHARVLAAAARIYRQRFRAEHDDAARAWLEAVRPKLRRVIFELPGRLEKMLVAAWPEEPIRVDLVCDATWAGAYTTVDPPRVTIAPGDPRNRDWLAVEILFHEASHVLIRDVSAALRRAAAEAEVEIARDLWHAVLFYTAGEAVRPFAGEGFVPYAEAQGLWDRVPAWADAKPAIEAEWAPWLRGERSFEAAIEALVRAAGRASK